MALRKQQRRGTKSKIINTLYTDRSTFICKFNNKELRCKIKLLYII